MSSEAANLSDMNTEELKEHLAEMERELMRREQEDKLEKARGLEKQAQVMGFVSLAEAARTLSGQSQADRPRNTYVHPKDSSKTWSGRGRKPKWVHDYVRSGGKLENLVPQNSDETS